MLLLKLYFQDSPINVCDAEKFYVHRYIHFRNADILIIGALLVKPDEYRDRLIFIKEICIILILPVSYIVCHEDSFL